MQAIFRGADDHPEAVDVALTTWRRFFDPYEPVHALVAERGADLVGLAHYLFHRNTLMPTGTCYLQDLFTSKAARGKGVGRKLIHAVYKEAKSAIRSDQLPPGVKGPLTDAA